MTQFGVARQGTSSVGMPYGVASDGSRRWPPQSRHPGPWSPDCRRKYVASASPGTRIAFDTRTRGSSLRSHSWYTVDRLTPFRFATSATVMNPCKKVVRRPSRLPRGIICWLPRTGSSHSGRAGAENAARGSPGGQLLLALVLIGTDGLAAAIRVFREGTVRRVVLPNGLTVVLAPDRKVPLVGMALHFPESGRAMTRRSGRASRFGQVVDGGAPRSASAKASTIVVSKPPAALIRSRSRRSTTTRSSSQFPQKRSRSPYGCGAIRWDSPWSDSTSA